MSNTLTLTSIFSHVNSTDHALVNCRPPFTLTYENLLLEINRIRNKLSILPLNTQDVVSVSLPSDPAFFIAFCALTFNRLAVAPLNPDLTETEIAFSVQDVKSKLIIIPQNAYKNNLPPAQVAKSLGITVYECWYDYSINSCILQPINQIPEPNILRSLNHNNTSVNPHDTALILHTSGTTGHPKAVPLSHMNVVSSLRTIVTTYDLTQHDRGYLMMPIFHVHGLIAGLLAPILAKGTVIMPGKFSARHFWSDITQYSITWFTAVPTMLQILLMTKPHNTTNQTPSATPLFKPPSSLRFIRSCSSPLSPTVNTLLEQTFQVPVVQAYAMTETAHQMASNPLPPLKRLTGSVGRATGRTEIRILHLNDKHEGLDNEEFPSMKVGEICVKGPNVMQGYLRNKEATQSAFTQAGFLRTGDLGYKDKDGYIFIVGRIKEMVNRGGEKISPIEVEWILMKYPNVKEVVCFGIPDEVYGQKLACMIVPHGGSEITPEHVKIWAKDKIAPYKIPDEIIIVNELPKTATGKVQRSVISENLIKRRNSMLSQRDKKVDHEFTTKGKL